MCLFILYIGTINDSGTPATHAMIHSKVFDRRPVSGTALSWTISAIFLVLLSAAAQAQGQDRDDELYNTFGGASHYRKDFSGPTASGELYDQRLNTAAHPSLPFGTRVRVTELRSGKSTIVHINDRCPIVTGNVIDLSWEAAKELGILEKPGIDVTVTELPDQSKPEVAQKPTDERKPTENRKPAPDAKSDGILKRLLPVSADAAKLPPTAAPPQEQKPKKNAFGFGSRQPIVPAEDGQAMNQPVLRIQFGAYGNPREADPDIRRLRQLKVDAILVRRGSQRWPYRLVTSGVFFDHSAAERWLSYIKGQSNPSFQDAFITR
ncbi:MAG: rare lipoprotein A [Verrucomicrobiales bacterium]